MNSQNYKIKNIVSSLILISFLAPAFLFLAIPRNANAFLGVGDIVSDPITEANTGITAGTTTTNTAITVKNVLKEVANQILKTIAKRALAGITKSTVNWINSGFSGAPLFVQNPGSFFNDITKFQVKDLISIIGYDQYRFPFGKQFALNTIDAYKRKLDSNAEYSLSKVVNDPTLLYNYRNNFGTGGWDGFLINTQYPQNNFIGAQMQLTNELARRLDITDPTTVPGKIQNALNQGQGFLSPQTCTGPNAAAYNAVIANQFQRPTFNFKPPATLVAPTIGDLQFQNPDGTTDMNALKEASDAYENEYNTVKASAKADWAKTNVCQGGLVNTTPGSVVANSIMTSLNGGQKLTELQAALGGSLSAVFDAVLNRYLDKGLNALATTISGTPPPPDTFDYFGNTLGSSQGYTNGNNGDVFSGPDEEIVLGQFKLDVAQGISDTKIELALMDNDPTDLTNPNKASGFGVTQMLSFIWPKIRELDICTPGPDLGWEARLESERQRNSQKFQSKLSDSDGKTVALAQLADNELKFSVNFFRDWIETKMMKSLPSSIIYMDAVNQVEDLEQQAKELSNNRRSKAQTLARLEAIQQSLSSFSTQPLPKSKAESDLITIKKQYNAVSYLISNSTTIEETRAERDAATDKFSTLQKLTAQCTNDRKTAGWTIPNGSWGDTLSNGFQSILPSAAGKLAYINIPGIGSRTVPTSGEEQEQFCNLPIVNGYSHGPYKNPSPVPVEYKDVPLVNALNVKYKNGSGFLGLGSDGTTVTLSCNLIYRATVLDYKGSLPGDTNITQAPIINDTGEVISGDTGTTDSGALGTCVYSNGTTQTNITKTTCDNGGFFGLQGSGTWTANQTNGNGNNPPPVNCGTDIACG